MDLRKQVIKAMNAKDYYHYNVFCSDVGIDRFNFSKWMNRRQSLSTGTLFKILNHLKILCPEHNLTRVNYLNVDDLVYLYENREELEKIFDALEELELRY